MTKRIDHVTSRFWRTFMLAISVSGLFFTGSLMAQTGGLSGEVRDASTGETLPGANIYLESSGIGTVTNIEGEFRLLNVPQGAHNVIISYIGYVSQTHEVEISGGSEAALNIDLEYDAVGLEEVVVSVQLLGQARAINQQLNSDALVNVVSSDKMKELPDVNAAEAIGRLPGISVQRTGGEANKVVVRGLSPKLTVVTINGIRVPSTSGTDRSVNLSMISPELLSSIEVFKSPTADMDGDAIGGIVNLGVMKAPMKRVATFQLNGGFSGLDNSFGNYKGSLDLSKRFLGNKLGILLKANYERMNRSSESISVGYNSDPGADGPWPVTNTSFTDNVCSIDRIGTTLGLDYQYSTGEVIGQVFYSLRKNDLRVTTNILNDGTIVDHAPRHSKSNLSVLQGMLSGKQRFNFMEIDWILASSNSVSDNYYDIAVEINEYGGLDIQGDVYSAQEKQDQRTYSYSSSWLRQTNWRPELTNQQNYTAGINFKMDYNLPGKLSGFLKFGGKYRYDTRIRSIDHFRIFQYYLNDNENDEAVANMLPLTTVVGGSTGRKIMLENFAQGTDELGIWGGEYTVSPLVDMDYLDLWYERQAQTLSRYPDITQPYNEYEVIETVTAGYFMTKINYGRWLSLIPGIRYEYSDDEYLGYISSLAMDGSGSKKDTTVFRNYGVLLPSMHVKIKPLDWFDVRLSAVKTLSRPDYDMITPRARIDLTNGRLYRGNPDLKHAEAWNYDAMLSFFANKLGLFTIGGFYKHFNNFFNKTDRVMSMEEAISHGYPAVVFDVQEDYINFDDSEVYGFEVDLQTNLSYLPSPFNGIVVNANVSRLWSKTFVPLFFKVTKWDPALRRNVVDIENSYYEYKETSLPDQTEWISNLTIGYDFRGFSARLSMIYQSAYLRGLSSSGEVSGSEFSNRYTDDFLRFDASLSQRIGDHIRIMANFANISGESERSYQYISDYWRSENRYGTTIDLGVQYRF
ncbi:MAG: TonB-dependent receptor [Bacteroidales bacterium]|nr:TonB-dependent receptor [Bacteroidales bacterium]